jgi:hypothetical protein
VLDAADQLELEFRNRAYKAVAHALGWRVYGLVLSTNPGLLLSVPAYKDYIEANWDDFVAQHKPLWEKEPRFSATEVKAMLLAAAPREPGMPSRESDRAKSGRTEAMRQDRAQEEALKDQCEHLKLDGRSNLKGFVTSDGRRFFICPMCRKEWIDSAVPKSLVPQLDFIGSAYDPGVDNEQ